MQRLHCLFGKQIRVSNFVNQPFSQTKTFNTNYLTRNWFTTQKEILKEEGQKEEPLFEVDVENQTYKLLKVKQELGPVNIKTPKSKYTVEKRIDDLATIDYIGKKLVWSTVHENSRKIGHMFEPNEIRPTILDEHSDNAPIKGKVSPKETCYFCAELREGAHPRLWDSMNLPFWRKFLNPYGAILGRRHTGTCSKHQRKVAKTVKRMIHMGLIGFKKGLQYDSPYVPPDQAFYIYENTEDTDVPEKEEDNDEEALTDEDELENDNAMEFYEDVDRPIPSNAEEWRNEISRNDDDDEEALDEEEEEEEEGFEEEEISDVERAQLAAEERQAMKNPAFRKMVEAVERLEAEEEEELERIKFINPKTIGLTAEDIKSLAAKPPPRKINLEKKKRREQKNKDRK